MERFCRDVIDDGQKSWKDSVVMDDGRKSRRLSAYNGEDSTKISEIYRTFAAPTKI